METKQTPLPGERKVHYCGDHIFFSLTVLGTGSGNAFLRTNLGHHRMRRMEIIERVEKTKNPLGRDWYDIPMVEKSHGHFELTLGLSEVGHFDAKCYYLKEGGKDPLWPEGKNVHINVSPADVCTSNIIYNAFVRQFGPNKSGKKKIPEGVEESHIKALDEDGYTVIPPSGTFRDLIAELDFIIDELGCRMLLLLPIHPTPTTYARMGRFGSPYAALSFTAVDPALAAFDPKATPLEQFAELTDAIHQRGAKILIDIAINHTGWAASLHETHPKWLSRDTEGLIERPGAWGVVWEDLTRLDYSHHDLWEYMAGIFLIWAKRGVDGFRADAGYMIPIDAWIYIISKVRDQFPNTLFLLEGLGGDVNVTRELLGRANFNFAYSELFQNYDRSQIEHYLRDAIAISESDGVTVHFAETHDNNRLASISKTWAKMRCALCALLSSQGAFGFANGVEWLAEEKIIVHDASSLNWGGTSHQVDWIKRLNTLISHHPAFFHPTRLEMLQTGSENILVVSRRPLQSGKVLLIIINLSADHPTHARWRDAVSEWEDHDVFTDLLTGDKIIPERERGERSLKLSPGKVLCLTEDTDTFSFILEKERASSPRLERKETQRLKEKIFEIDRIFNGMRDVTQWDMDAAIDLLKKDPYACCASFNPKGIEPFVVTFEYPLDLKREVMVPPGHFLLVRSPVPFHLRIAMADTILATEESLTDSSGGYFTLAPPLLDQASHQHCSLMLTLFSDGAATHKKASLLYLTKAEHVGIQCVFKKPFSKDRSDLILGVNKKGAMMRLYRNWQELHSRYDALLAGNLNTKVPCDRHMMLARFRGWCLYQGFSQDIHSDCLDHFGFDYDSNAYFQYHVHTGQGQHVILSYRFRMVPFENSVQVTIYRHGAANKREHLADKLPITLILRPDIEDRNFHHVTKAYQGLEKFWPEAIRAHKKGFEFIPSKDRKLCVFTNSGAFIHESEWHYMTHRRWEEDRGMDPSSDLFSPGYFSVELKGRETITLSANIVQNHDEPIENVVCPFPDEVPFRGMQHLPDYMEIVEGLKGALSQYVVNRDDYQTVIAGYPWFLDWGRDTLIVVRGIIAAKQYEEAESILMQFARFEESGTLPNMIRGEDASNRNTSDAALWMFIATADLIDARGDDHFLDRKIEGRGESMREILIGMAMCLINGTPNGIFMDASSGLLYSPTHFTWMDTNHPPGTPRQGYPIEIQALWNGALMLLSRIDEEKRRDQWRTLSEKVKSSITRYFFLEDKGYLSDCLHSVSPSPASDAIADDALRPNQLYAITLGALDDPSKIKRILNACEKLLVPGAIRTLHDQEVNPPLPIMKDGHLVNNPTHPYAGEYKGDEDTRRKPAYHNGTAWTWVFPSYAEAYAQCYGDESGGTALSLLSSSVQLINTGCLGHIPEIVDGNYPHYQRGCDAQAWGVSELIRVWVKLFPICS